MKARFAHFLILILALGITAAEEPAPDAQKPEAAPEEAAHPAEEPTAAPAGEKSAAEAPVEENTPAAPEPGLAVRVERLQKGSGDIDASQVKLLAPFPAKLLAQVPAGWRIEKANNAPPFTREVELSPGSTITLSVKPQVLVPEADGRSVFAVPEPGYNAALGYHQNATVGSILATSIRQLDDDARQLGEAIEQLQHLLVSLPKSEPPIQENPTPAQP
jgi:hypothetical protein